MQIDGDTVLAFLAGVDKAMEDAGNGQHRAFKLMANLRAMGIALTAIEVPPLAVVAQAPDNLAEIRKLASAGEPLIDIHKDRSAAAD